MALASFAGAQTKYTVTDLGTLGGNNSYAGAINDAGDAVGWSNVPDTNFHAFLWTSSGGLQDIGTLGGDYAVAVAINSSQQVIGTSTAAGGYQHNFLWSPTTGFTVLQNDILVGINSSGEIALYGYGKNAKTYHSFVWTAATGRRDLGLLQGQTSSTAQGINDLGQVVGVAGIGEFPEVPEGFYWTKTKGTQLVPGSSYLKAIDNQGASTGWVEVGYFINHAILWSEASGVTDLGTLTGGSLDTSAGLGISVNGQIVGYSSVNGACCYAIVYSKAAGMQDLNTLINGSWFISYAVGINSTGQILADGYPTGGPFYEHALLLTPQ